MRQLKQREVITLAEELYEVGIEGGGVPVLTMRQESIASGTPLVPPHVGLSDRSAIDLRVRLTAYERTQGYTLNYSFRDQTYFLLKCYLSISRGRQPKCSLRLRCRFDPINLLWTVTQVLGHHDHAPLLPLLDLQGECAQEMQERDGNQGVSPVPSIGSGGPETVKKLPKQWEIASLARKFVKVRLMTSVHSC